MTYERPHCPHGHGQLTIKVETGLLFCTSDDCDYDWQGYRRVVQ